MRVESVAGPPGEPRSVETSCDRSRRDRRHVTGEAIRAPGPAGPGPDPVGATRRALLGVRAAARRIRTRVIAVALALVAGDAALPGRLAGADADLAPVAGAALLAGDGAARQAAIALPRHPGDGDPRP